jgi:hypothetical protein
MTVWERFDSIVCLNLDRRPDRWAQALGELRLCGLDGRCQRISAVDRPNDGNAGCTASHRAIWAKIASGEMGDHVLIFEDDFQVMTRDLLVEAKYADVQDTMRIFDSLAPSVPASSVADWLAARLSTMLDVPANWDLLYLGGGYASPPKGRVNKWCIRNNGMLTTHSYAIARKFARLITEHLDENWGDEYPGPPDSVLCQYVGADAFCSYTLSPRLFIQRAGVTSDLTGRVHNFPYSMTDPVHEMMV